MILLLQKHLESIYTLKNYIRRQFLSYFHQLSKDVFC